MSNFYESKSSSSSKFVAIPRTSDRESKELNLDLNSECLEVEFCVEKTFSGVTISLNHGVGLYSHLDLTIV